MDFSTILIVDDFGNAEFPYAGKDAEGNWIAGGISIDFLNAVFGQYSIATEMKEATSSDGLILFFDYLVSEGKIPC